MTPKPTENETELDKILTDMVEDTVMIITNDLPSLLQHEETYEIRRHHKNEILKNIPEAKARLLTFITSDKQRLLNKARLSEEHYWIDEYSRQIKALDGFTDKPEKDRLKRLRKQHQERAESVIQNKLEGLS